ncbi:MAG: hypothetical protein KDK63_00575 [Chlamydiia bacterium]|nr:hypothetical protein [Chlamydiia bacterium]
MSVSTFYCCQGFFRGAQAVYTTFEDPIVKIAHLIHSISPSFFARLINISSDIIDHIVPLRIAGSSLRIAGSSMITNIFFIFGIFDAVASLYISAQSDPNFDDLSSKDPSEMPRIIVYALFHLAALVTLSALAVFAIDRIRIPTSDFPTLLKECGIPEVDLKNIQMAWHKSWSDHIYAEVICFKLFLTLHQTWKAPSYQKGALVLLDLLTLYHITGYKTVALTRTFNNMESDTATFLALPEIKKIETTFHINMRGLQHQALQEKVRSIYNYSTAIFNISKISCYGQIRRLFWGILPIKSENSLFFGKVDCLFSEVAHPPTFDLGTNGIYNRSISFSAILKKCPPAPLAIRILYEGTLWQTFQGVDFFRWVPKLFQQGYYYPYKQWIEVKLSIL